MLISSGTLNTVNYLPATKNLSAGLFVYVLGGVCLWIIFYHCHKRSLHNYIMLEGGSHKNVMGVGGLC